MRRGAAWALFMVCAAAGLSRGGETVMVQKRGGTLVLTNLAPGKGPSVARGAVSSRVGAGSAQAVGAILSPRPYSALVKRVSDRYGIDHNLVHAIIAVESAYDPMAVSRQGAVGLMQLLPTTAAELGIHDLTDAHDNIVGGVRHLKRMLDQFSGNLTLALAAYNAGAGAVKRFKGVPPYPETQAYVRRVRRFYAGAGHIIRRAPTTIYRYTDASGAQVYSQFAPPASSDRGGGHRR
ncbi:MAG: lytic transglycosylase domain-containing protein [Acidobacteria bacterium]|nr:lytic transglycosylase domain-containing protein [Acidobacteriota bacterium]